MQSAPNASPSPPFVVAIGASGGMGLSDIGDLLAALPADLAAIVLVCLHRPVDAISHLKAILERCSALPVSIADESETLEIGACYVGEPAAHLTLAARSLPVLIDDPANTWRNRTVDALFGSVATHAGPCAIGVVLSGALDDGSRGLAAIHKAGGTTMILSLHGETQTGMPRNAETYDGAIDFIGSANEIAAAIARRVQQA